MQQLLSKIARRSAMLLALVLAGFSLFLAQPAQAAAPSDAVQFEYGFWHASGVTYANSQFDSYPFTCSSSSKSYQMGQWAAQNGYKTFVYAIGNPTAFASMMTSQTSGIYFFGTSDPTLQRSRAKAYIQQITSCYRQGWGYDPYGEFSMALSINNDTTDGYTAGNLGGDWSLNAGLTPFVNFETDWSNVTTAKAIVSAWYNVNSSGVWYDAAWRSLGTWAYTDYMDYINSVGSYFYVSNFLYPQNYYKNMNQCGVFPVNQSGCSTESQIGSHVVGATVEPGDPAPPRDMWENYQAQQYPGSSSARVVIVMAYASETYAQWSSY